MKDAPAAARAQLIINIIPAIAEVRANYLSGCRGATLRMTEFLRFKKSEAKVLSIKLVRQSLEKLATLIEMEDGLLPSCTYVEIVHVLVMFQFAW